MQNPVLKTQYLESIIPIMMKSRSYKNKHQVPSVEKIVLNSGISSLLDRNAIEETVREMSILSGQKPIITKARKSIANFKVREGMPLGVKVTLRGNQLYEFLYRLLGIALPGIRDFRGGSSKFDGHGNYSIGIDDITIFPEIEVDKVKHALGMDITIVTTAKNNDDAHELIKEFGMPFDGKR